VGRANAGGVSGWAERLGVLALGVQALRGGRRAGPSGLASVSACWAGRRGGLGVAVGWAGHHPGAADGSARRSSGLGSAVGAAERAELGGAAGRACLAWWAEVLGGGAGGVTLGVAVGGAAERVGVPVGPSGWPTWPSGSAWRAGLGPRRRWPAWAVAGPSGPAWAGPSGSAGQSARAGLADVAGGWASGSAGLGVARWFWAFWPAWPSACWSARVGLGRGRRRAGAQHCEALPPGPDPRRVRCGVRCMLPVLVADVRSYACAQIHCHNALIPSVIFPLDIRPVPCYDSFRRRTPCTMVWLLMTASRSIRWLDRMAAESARAGEPGRFLRMHLTRLGRLRLRRRKQEEA